MKTSLPKSKFPATVVGIDVETTSLDPTTGEIIEVAAVRFDTKTGLVVDRYVALCQPSAPLAAEITAITNITNDMLAGKAAFASHVAKLRKFIGRDIVFAHNASFDLNYLAGHGLKITNTVWDTFALASIAWPETESYNLGLLHSTYVVPTPKKSTQKKGRSAKKPPKPINQTIDSSNEHRAEYDVMITWELLNAIRQQLTVSSAAFQNIKHLLTSAPLSHYLPLFTPKPKDKKEPSRQKTTSAPDSSDYPDLSIEDILGPDGILSQHPSFTYRQQQLEMARSIISVFDNKKIGLIEAGTGTGKTYGYLAPLLLRIISTKKSSSRSSARSVSIISTYTKHLQDQLYDHDIPRLLDLLQLPLKTAKLKGRRNYLCTGRLAQSLQKDRFNSQEVLFLVKLLVWLEYTSDGDLERLNLSHQDARFIYHLHADSISCRNSCPTNNPSCPYHVARQRAKEADLVIVNHALLVQMGSDESSFELDQTIIDEAHHLEAAARDATARDLSLHMLAEVIAPFVQLTKGDTESSHQRITQEAQSVIDAYQLLLHSISSFLTDHAQVTTLRLNTSVRKGTKWQKIVDQGTTWRSQLQFLIGLMQGIPTKSSNEEKKQEAISEAEQFSQNFHTFITGDQSRIQWLELSPYAKTGEASVSLHDTSLSVQPIIGNTLRNMNSVVLTSATLTVGNNYDYIKRRLGIEEADEFIFGSPFDYKRQMMIFIVDDAPSPHDSSYQQFIARQFLNLSKLTSGRLLGLFTSHQLVKDVYYKILKELNKAKIRTLAQKLTGGRHNMIKKFQKTHSSILLGTYSFWEGIDIPGESLSSVVVVKLPFSPPHDPIIDAIAEDEKISSFNNLSVPTMILRLRQGIGRLIRSQNDYGVVVILDSRFLHQDYGQQVLNSLPPATVHIGSQKDLLPIITDWFGTDQLERWKSELNSGL